MPDIEPRLSNPFPSHYTQWASQAHENEKIYQFNESKWAEVGSKDNPKMKVSLNISCLRQWEVPNTIQIRAAMAPRIAQPVHRCQWRGILPLWHLFAFNIVPSPLGVSPSPIT
jgi:hypothetical protein